jgi:hypothetical protein
VYVYSPTAAYFSFEYSETLWPTLIVERVRSPCHFAAQCHSLTGFDLFSSPFDLVIKVRNSNTVAYKLRSTRETDTMHTKLLMKCKDSRLPVKVKDFEASNQYSACIQRASVVHKSLRNMENMISH